MSNPVIERLRALCVPPPPHDPGQGLRDVSELRGLAAGVVRWRGRCPLVAMKRLSVSERRSKDAQDLVEWLSTIDEAELARAREAIARMDALGTSRGKDLAADLDRRLAVARG